METLLVVLISLLLVGMAALAFLIYKGRSVGGDSAVAARLEDAQARIRSLEAEVEERRKEAESARLEAARALEQAALEKKNLEDQRAALKEMDAQLKDSFKAIASGTLDESIKSFLQLASENLDRRHSESSAELEKRRVAIEEMIKPLNQRLAEVRELSEQLGRERKEGEGSLKSLLTGMTQEQGKLRETTFELVNALKNNQALGDLGQMVLEQLFDWAGFKLGVHYDKQVVTQGDENRRLMPDFVVHLPGNRDVIIDSKAVFQDYFDATKENDPAKRDEHLKQHAQKLREQVSQLSRKEYQRHVSGNPAEFTVLFLPSDPALTAAYQVDEKLFEKAYKDNIILASPSVLMALLRIVEKGWRDAEMAQNAQKIADAGKDLLNRFRVFWDHLGSLRKGLGSAVKAYNDTVGSLDRSVVPGTKKLMEMGVKGDRKVSNTLSPSEMPIDVEIRESTTSMEDLGSAPN